MPNTYAYVLRTYRTASVAVVLALILAIIKGILGSPLVFKVAPFTELEAQAVYDALYKAQSEYKLGGQAQKTAMLLALQNAIALLDKSALSVESVAVGDHLIIELSGFTATLTSNTHGQVPGQAVNVKQDKNSVSGQILVSCETSGVGHSYGCVLSEEVALPVDFVMTVDGQFKILTTYPVLHFNVSHSRIKSFMNLTVNKKYYVYFYVINATGVGPLSEAIIINCS